MKRNRVAFKEVEISEQEPVYTSGVVCRLLGIPIWVLKQLDREKLVSPIRKKAKGHRLYSQKELKRLNYLWYLIREKGVNVDGLKVILELQGSSKNQKKGGR
jgi:MerR family transcriptional regulator/heat shock protein HspR